MSAVPCDQHFPAIYGELRRLAAAQLARERVGHTLNATALVHEAYLRLGGKATFADRSAFLRAASVAMQRILVDHARKKQADKRGGRSTRLIINEGHGVSVTDPDTLLDIDDALNRLAEIDPSSADVARFRLFAGLTVEEAADALGLSRTTAFREWAFARSWITAAMKAHDPC